MMLVLQKRVSSSPETPHIFIPRDEELIGCIDLETRRDITWHTVSMKRPRKILDITETTSADVEDWVDRENDQEARRKFGNESFIVDLTKLEKTEVSEATKTRQLPDEKRAKLEEDTFGVEQAFYRLLMALKQEGKIKEIPKRLPARLFFFSDLSSQEGETIISPNKFWHIDFFSQKEGPQLKTLLEEESYLYIATLTEPGGPTTLVLNADQMEVPVLKKVGDGRIQFLDWYIDEQIASGKVTMSALDPNTWYALDTRGPHRGPGNTDTCFSRVSRAFLHVVSSTIKMNA